VNYFEFYNISVSFYPEVSKIKKAYFSKSKEFHPDFFTNATEEEKNNSLEQTSFNNNAYKTLMNEELRFKYILELDGIIGSDTKEEMPQEFLLGMMEFNEELMDLQFEFQEDKYLSLSKELEKIQLTLKQSCEPLLQKYPNVNNTEKLTIKNFYFQSKYLHRLFNNLKNLAPSD